MKIFISACAAFALSTFIVLFSLFYSSNALETAIDILAPLPNVIEEDANKKTSEDILGCLNRANQYWSDKTDILSLFINHKDLDEIESHLATLISSVKSSDAGHYASTLAALREKLEKLSVSESISVSGIL